MTSDLIVYIGIIICCVSVLGAIVASVLLHLAKVRLNKRLDIEFGKRRH